MSAEEPVGDLPRALGRQAGGDGADVAGWAKPFGSDRSGLRSRIARNLAQRLGQIGHEPGDSPDLRARKSLLVQAAVLMALLAFVWVGIYAALGLWLSAAIPFAYQLACVVTIWWFARTRRFGPFRAVQLAMILALPFALQWSLGGFENGSAVALWAFVAPLGALMFGGRREAVPWFAAFVVLVVVSAAIDPALRDDPPEIPYGVRLGFFALTIACVAGTAFAMLQYFIRARDREQAKSERLLLNVLPEPVAARLKESDEVIADDFAEVTVLFADLVGFTPLSDRLPAAEVVAALDRVFAAWDELAARHGVEKIKTIGDAYMAAAGLPVPRPDHAEAIADLALAMLPAAARCAEDTALPLEVRIGIDSGPAMAGVIGRSRLIYDLWGDTVNTAARMESHAPPGAIQVTERARVHLERRGYALEPRGTIEVKGKGAMATWLLVGRDGA